MNDWGSTALLLDEIVDKTYERRMEVVSTKLSVLAVALPSAMLKDGSERIIIHPTYAYRVSEDGTLVNAVGNVEPHVPSNRPNSIHQYADLAGNYLVNMSNAGTTFAIEDIRTGTEVARASLCSTRSPFTADASSSGGGLCATIENGKLCVYVYQYQSSNASQNAVVKYSTDIKAAGVSLQAGWLRVGQATLDVASAAPIGNIATKVGDVAENPCVYFSLHQPSNNSLYAIRKSDLVSVATMEQYHYMVPDIETRNHFVSKTVTPGGTPCHQLSINAKIWGSLVVTIPIPLRTSQSFNIQGGVSRADWCLIDCGDVAIKFYESSKTFEYFKKPLGFRIVEYIDSEDLFLALGGDPMVIGDSSAPTETVYTHKLKIVGV